MDTFQTRQKKLQRNKLVGAHCAAQYALANYAELLRLYRQSKNREIVRDMIDELPLTLEVLE